MKRMTTLCLAAALAGGSAIGAQAAQSRAATQSSSRSTARPTTLVGCLSEQGSGPPTYILSIAGEQPASESPRPVGTSGSEQRVQLVAGGRLDLADQVGQRIEVTGELVTPRTARTRARQPATAMQMNVDNVRSVAPTCNAGR